MRGTGADQPVVASKPGNAGGAKGLNGSAKGMDQPAMGGIHAGSEVVRRGSRRGPGVNQRWEEPMPEAKPYAISKQVVWEAYQKVKANHGAAGVDGQSIEAFETDLKGNLYKIWNRMSSGSYFPPPVRLVEIPKANGGSTAVGNSHGRRPRGADGRQDASGAAGGAAFPSRLLRVSSRKIGAGCGGHGAGAVLAVRLGDRSGYQRFL